jgi:hypothetical protein
MTEEQLPATENLVGLVPKEGRALSKRTCRTRTATALQVPIKLGFGALTRHPETARYRSAMLPPKADSARARVHAISVRLER